PSFYSRWLVRAVGLSDLHFAESPAHCRQGIRQLSACVATQQAEERHCTSASPPPPRFGVAMTQTIAPISVLMSTYGGENPVFLQQVLISCIRQEVKPTEIVLVLDGPVGSSQERVIEDFRCTAENAAVATTLVPLERNMGLGPALNAGLQRCQ